MAVPITAPFASRIVTVAPASPDPETIAPSPLIAAISPVGAVMSGAVSDVAGERLPPRSVWSSDNASPLAWGGDRGAENPPSAPTMAVAISVPSTFRTLTVAKGSPVPVTLVPSAATVAIGAAGAVRSGAATVAGCDGLPAGSVCTADSVWPPVCGGVRSRVKLLSAATTALPRRVPLPSTIRTIAPGSPLP